MHFYVLNPKIGFIAKVTEKPSLDQLRSIIDCRLIDAARLHGTSDVLICDDEGLFVNDHMLGIEQESLLHIQGIDDRILAGTCVYIGTSPQGESIEPEHTFMFPVVEPSGSMSWHSADDSKTAVARIIPQMKVNGNFMSLPFILSPKMGVPTIPEFRIESFITYQSMEYEKFTQPDNHAERITSKFLGFPS